MIEHAELAAEPFGERDHWLGDQLSEPEREKKNQKTKAKWSVSLDWKWEALFVYLQS